MRRVARAVGAWNSGYLWEESTARRQEQPHDKGWDATLDKHSLLDLPLSSVKKQIRHDKFLEALPICSTSSSAPLHSACKCGQAYFLPDCRCAAHHPPPVPRPPSARAWSHQHLQPWAGGVLAPTEPGRGSVRRASVLGAVMLCRSSPRRRPVDNPLHRLVPSHPDELLPVTPPPPSKCQLPNKPLALPSLLRQTETALHTPSSAPARHTPVRPVPEPEQTWYLKHLHPGQHRRRQQPLMRRVRAPAHSADGEGFASRTRLSEWESQSPDPP